MGRGIAYNVGRIACEYASGFRANCAFLGETVVRLRSNEKLYSGRGLSTDIVGASIHAYINALNKIVYEEVEA